MFLTVSHRDSVAKFSPQAKTTIIIAQQTCRCSTIQWGVKLQNMLLSRDPQSFASSSLPEDQETVVQGS